MKKRYSLSMIDDLHPDIKSRLPLFAPLIIHLPKQFIEISPNSDILPLLWTEMILLSFFREKDRNHLRSFHLDCVHNKFLHALANFHIYYSELRCGSHWIGGLKTYPTSLSDELGKIPIHLESAKLTELYQHYNELLHGKFSSYLILVYI